MARCWALTLPYTRQVTVLQIAALKKVTRGTRILLLDRNGGAAKAIARELSRRGFRRTYVVQGGFSNWTSSKLQTKLSGSVRARRNVLQLANAPLCRHGRWLRPLRTCHGGGCHARGAARGPEDEAEASPRRVPSTRFRASTPIRQQRPPSCVGAPADLLACGVRARARGRAQVSSVEVLSPGNLFGTIRSSVNGKVLPLYVPSLSHLWRPDGTSQVLGVTVTVSHAGHVCQACPRGTHTSLQHCSVAQRSSGVTRGRTSRVL